MVIKYSEQFIDAGIVKSLGIRIVLVYRTVLRTIILRILVYVIVHIRPLAQVMTMWNANPTHHLIGLTWAHSHTMIVVLRSS